MNAAYALQIALRTRLTADPAFSALIPSANVIDSHGLPERFPCAILGEDQEVGEDLTFERRHVRVFQTLHVWHREPGLAHAKQVAGAIRAAIRGELPALENGARLVDLRFEGARFLRDPGGALSHGVVTLEALVELPA